MNTPISKLLRTLNFYLAIVTLTLMSSSAFSQDPATSYAGSIVYTKGGVVAIDANGESRPLARRMDIHIGDTLYTAAESSVQLSMSDSAQIVLGESTVFEISEYTYQEDDSDSVVLNLVEGGFRTVTGNVAKSNYRAEVNGFSNIGIRGTEYEARIVEEDRLLVGLYDGGVTVSNFGGEIDLGLGADFDFAEVNSMFSAPVGLDEVPVGLNELPIVVAVQVPEEEEEDAAAIANTVDTLNTNAGLIADINPDLVQPGAVAGQTVDTLDSVVAIAANTVPTADALLQANSVAGLDTLTSTTFGSVRALARNVDTSLVNDVAQNVSTLVSNTDFVADAVAIEVPALLDSELNAATNLLQFADESTAALADVVTPLQDNSLLAVVSGLVQDTNLESLDLTDVDPVADIVDSVVDVVTVVDTTVPVVVDTASDLVDGATGAVDDVTDTVTTVTDSVTDTVADTATGAGGSLLDIVEDVVDATTDTVADVVDTTTDTVAGVDDVVDTATDTIASVEDGVETAVEDIVETVVDTVEDTTDTVVEIADTVEDTVDGTVEDVADTVGDVLAGLTGASDGTESETEGESGGSLGGFFGGSSLFATKQAPTEKKLASSDTWGAWNEPVPEHIAQSLTISAGDYSVDLTPTSVANLTGAYQYSDVVGFEGQGSAGALTNVQAGFDVDFNTGVIENGMLSVAVEDTQNWVLGFDGMVEQGVVDLNSLGGTLVEFGSNLDTSSPIDGNLSGAFAGEHGESFVGGFELLDMQNAANTVDGIYTVER